MTARAQRSAEPIVYPDSDGQPMADNTEQFRWIVSLKENLDALLSDFVGGDLLWYPVVGHPEVRVAPDVLVALGRPKGPRGSYRQWEEDDIPPAVVFEVLSPSNTAREMFAKLGMYNRYGVDEFYVVDPDVEVVQVFVRTNGGLQEVELPATGGFTSPRLGISFTRDAQRLVVRAPDGRPFRTFAEIKAERDAIATERDAVATERDAIATERDAIATERDAIATERDAIATERDAIATERDAAERRAGAAEQRAARLTERMRELGLDPDDV